MTRFARFRRSGSFCGRSQDDRVGKDGQPYWSARDLAKLFGYSDWRNFAAAIHKARQQVDAHVNAGHDHFVDVTEMVQIGSGAARKTPNVHLTRFAAYFVALNADQSKPESTALDTPMRGCMIQRPNAVECNDVRGTTCEHPGKKDVSAGHSVSPCNTFPLIVRGCNGFGGIARGCARRAAPLSQF